MSILFILFFLLLFVFEFINGFHDTANAVATVIYTKSLKPYQAVLWSGVCNIAGAMLGGVAVAYGIFKLFPLAILINAADFQAFIAATLISAIIWNWGTWYKAIPCSSSHTLFGSIVGANLGFIFVHGGSIDGLTRLWIKAQDIVASLFFSPFLGFFMAFIIFRILRRVLPKTSAALQEEKPDKAPTHGIRATLIATSTLVSFAHGANDGQKGMGIALMITIALAPNLLPLGHEMHMVETLLVESHYLPTWLILSTALALGLGTVVGWKRMVITIGEKIGKNHLKYAQGAASELTAALTIGFSTLWGLPVSTTHVLSSAVAGTMVADKGFGNLNPETIRKIPLVWLVTLPLCIVGSFFLFVIFYNGLS